MSTAASKQASKTILSILSILSFLELSRKLEIDGSDTDLVEVAGKIFKTLEDDVDDMILDPLLELIDQFKGKMKDAA